MKQRNFIILPAFPIVERAFECAEAKIHTETVKIP